MGKRYLQRSELYEVLVKAIEKRLKEEELVIQDITPEVFGMSERQFYYLKKSCKSDNVPGLSESKIKEVAKKIGLQVEFRFWVKNVK